jgi:hypothetical protein
MLLTHRKLLQSKAIAIDSDLRDTLRNVGLKVGKVVPAGWAALLPLDPEPPLGLFVSSSGISNPSPLLASADTPTRPDDVR